MGKLTPKRPARLKAEVIEGDCREVMAKMLDASVDSIVTDPPYHLTSIVDRFGKPNAAPAQHGRDGAYARQSKGFMGKTWDGGDIAQSVELWREAWRVLKPGGHLLAFGGTRTAHRMVCAIEDAGFEIRDSIMWVYGSGFPKSHDVSKEIDKRAGAKREVVGINQGAIRNKSRDTVWTGDVWGDNGATITAPATDAAKQWEGWGSALKPSHEPVVHAVKNHRDVPFICDSTEVSSLLEGLLWLFAPVKFAELVLLSSRREWREEDRDIVRWLVAVSHGLLLNAPELKTGTSISQETVSTFLSIVTSWNSILAVVWKHGSMFTTEMKSEMTIALGTLKSFILRIMPASIIMDGTIANGLRLGAVTAAKSSTAHKYGSTQYLANFADADATSLREIERMLVSIAERFSRHQKTIVASSAPRSVRTVSTTNNVRERLRILAHIVGLPFTPSPLEDLSTAAESAWRPHSEKTSPSHEPICLARKPLSGTIAANVLKHGTGALNINGCRVDSGERPHVVSDRRLEHNTFGAGLGGSKAIGKTVEGRWPANLIHDGSAEVEAEFPASSGGAYYPSARGAGGISTAGHAGQVALPPCSLPAGSASRFFYSPKASKEDREEVYAAVPEKYRNLHPTVKPVALMRYLCRLITPPGGLVLDPFCGSGSTGKAALIEGFQFIGIENDLAYVEIARARVQPPLFASYAPTPAPRRSTPK